MQTTLADVLSSYLLIDLSVDESKPPVDHDAFLQQFEQNGFDLRAPLAPQLAKHDLIAAKQFTLPPNYANGCVLIDFIFEALEMEARLSDAVLNNLVALKTTLLKLILNDPLFIKSPSHPVRKMLDELCCSMTGWCLELGESGETVLNGLKALVTETAVITGKEADLPGPVVKRLADFRELFIPFAQKERQIQLSEVRYVKDREPQYRVDGFLDELVYAKTFPAAVCSFLTREWRNALLHYAKKSGFSSEAWTKLSEFSASLIESYALETDSPSDLAISKIRPAVSQFLAWSPNEKARALKVVDETNSVILNNARKSGQTIRPLLEKNRLKNLNFSSSIIKTVSGLARGQWVLFEHPENGFSRLKIVGILKTSQEFVLSDLATSKIFIKSFQGLAYLLMTKKAWLLPNDGLFNRCFELAEAAIKETFESVTANRQRQKEDDISAERKKVADMQEKAELLRKQKEREKAELEKRYLEELERLKSKEFKEKAALSNEIQSILEEKQKLEQQLEQKSEENRKHQATQLVKALSIGSWVSLSRLANTDEQTDTQDNKLTPCKIAVIYAASGKYVFVDGKGVRVAEHTAEDLVVLLLEGKAEVLKEQNNFDRSMEQIIKSLKQ